MTQNKDIMNKAAALAEENLAQVTGGNGGHATGPDGREYYFGDLDHTPVNGCRSQYVIGPDGKKYGLGGLIEGEEVCTSI